MGHQTSQSVTMQTVFFITAAILLLGSSCVSAVSFQRHISEGQISAFKGDAVVAECEGDFVPRHAMNAHGGVQI